MQILCRFGMTRSFLRSRSAWPGWCVHRRFQWTPDAVSTYKSTQQKWAHTTNAHYRSPRCTLLGTPRLAGVWYRQHLSPWRRWDREPVERLAWAMLQTKTHRISCWPMPSRFVIDGYRAGSLSCVLLFTVNGASQTILRLQVNNYSTSSRQRSPTVGRLIGTESNPTLTSQPYGRRQSMPKSCVVASHKAHWAWFHNLLLSVLLTGAIGYEILPGLTGRVPIT